MVSSSLGPVWAGPRTRAGEINPDDRRSFMIHLSDAGRELADRCNGLLEALESNIRGRADPRAVEGFHAVMAAVEEVTRVRLRER